MTPPVSRAVLVTVCSSGIGRATAERLARVGWPVFATARRVESIRDLEGAGCRCLALDVCDESSMRDAVEAVEKEHGAVGALVNNAGYGSEGPIEEIAMEEVRRQFETNVFGLLRLTQLVLPGMRRQRFGRIVNLSSMGGRLTLPGGGVYHATKYAVEALSDALRFEVRGFGIDVAVIEPGAIKTRFGDTAIGRVYAAAHREPDPRLLAVGRPLEDQLHRAVRALAEGPLAVAEIELPQAQEPLAEAERADSLQVAEESLPPAAERLGIVARDVLEPGGPQVARPRERAADGA